MVLVKELELLKCIKYRTFSETERELVEELANLYKSRGVRSNKSRQCKFPCMKTKSTVPISVMYKLQVFCVYIRFFILGGKNEKQASDGGDDIGNDSVERTNNGENLWESIKKLAG